MFHSLRKWRLLIFIPCLLIMGLMLPLVTFAKPVSNNQHRMLTAQGGAHIKDIVKDGGFETPVVNTDFVEYNAGQAFGAWKVTTGSIDLIGTYWVSAQGAQSVDLNGSGAGTISQNLSTRARARYNLSFRLAGNPVCGPVEKKMQIVWGSTVLGTLTFDTTFHTTTNMGWLRYTFLGIKAKSAKTVLSFVSLTPSACGPALDDVMVTG